MDGKFAYATNFESGAISIIDTEKLELVKTVNVERNPVAMAFTDKYLYFTGWGDCNYFGL